MSQAQHLLVAFAPATVASTPACSALGSIDVGYQQPFSSAEAPGHRGVAVELHYGGGIGDLPVGLEFALRTKQGSGC